MKIANCHDHYRFYFHNTDYFTISKISLNSHWFYGQDSKCRCEKLKYRYDKI